MQAPEPLHLSTQSVRWFPQIAQYDCAIFVTRLKLELAGGCSAPATSPIRANIAISTKTTRIIYLFTNFRNAAARSVKRATLIAKANFNPIKNPPLLLSD
jgi:hypothetical protein